MLSEAKEELTKQEAAWALGTLAVINPTKQDEIRKTGGIKPIIDLIKKTQKHENESPKAVAIFGIRLWILVEILGVRNFGKIRGFQSFTVWIPT